MPPAGPHPPPIMSNHASHRTVFWQDGALMMIDQRLLPAEFVLAEFADVDEVAFSIRDMVVRGAPAIGATGAYGMVLAAQQSQAADRAGLLADLAAAKRTLVATFDQSGGRLRALLEAITLSDGFRYTTEAN